MRESQRPHPRGSRSKETPGPEDEDHANVNFPPPLIHGLGVVAGIGLAELVLLVLPRLILLFVLGVGLLAVSMLISVSAFRQFGHKDNPVSPNQPVNGLMSSGPFRYTRNPLYLALALLHGGIGLVSGNAWILLTLLPALLVVRYYVIAREEVYLTRRFGQAYLDYQACVRRWL
jgi:protein-S-isoprenylcysteine O-methyltransferase Ste14